MDQATRLYVMTPELEEISRLCDRVWAMVGNCDIYLSDNPTNEELDNTRKRLLEEIKDYPSSWSHFLKLYKLLDDPKIDKLGYREASLIFQSSISIFAWPDNPQECQDAAFSIVECMDNFYQWLRSEREKYFGYWGNRFIESIVEFTPIEDIKKFSRQFANRNDYFLEGQNSSSFLKRSNHGLSREIHGVPLVIDTTKYKILFRDCRECSLGNTKLFQLFMVLAKNPDKYLPISRIVELMGDHQCYARQLKVCKRRLCERLEKDHCNEIADAIQSQRGEYGIFLEERYIKASFVVCET